MAAALVGPPAIAALSLRLSGSSPGVGEAVAWQFVLWALWALVLCIVVLWERLPLVSIGIKKPRWSTWALGVALALVLIFVLVPASLWLLRVTALPGFREDMAPLLALPVWYRVFAAVTAGVVEETLYRGYAIERLASLTGSYAAGGSISLVASTLAHAPTWGGGPLLVFFLSGILTTLVYVWRRDLLVTVIAHATTDVVGLAVLPPDV